MVFIEDFKNINFHTGSYIFNNTNVMVDAMKKFVILVEILILVVFIIYLSLIKNKNTHIDNRITMREAYDIANFIGMWNKLFFTAI